MSEKERKQNHVKCLWGFLMIFLCIFLVGATRMRQNVRCADENALLQGILLRTARTFALGTKPEDRADFQKIASEDPGLMIRIHCTDLR